MGVYFFKWNIIKANDPCKNVLSTHTKQVEPYDLMFENHMQPKKKCSIFFVDNTCLSTN